MRSTLAISALCSLVAAQKLTVASRRFLSWLVPYDNVTSIEGYEQIWSQWGASSSRVS